jgi:GT2 family glycosyltransferase
MTSLDPLGSKLGRMAVVVVSFNTRDVLRDCLQSVVAAAPAEIIVVDNGSMDGSADMVRQEFPGVRLVEAENRGYGAGANLGVRSSSSEYVLVLNSDTLLMDNAIPALGRYLDENLRAGVAGPRLRNADGSLQPSCSAFLGTFRLALEKSPLARPLTRVPGVRDRLLLRHSSHDHPRRVPWVVGAALAIRRSAFEAVDGFDESFFMYAEEVDLCYRLSRRGWETHFAPVTDVVHLGGASTAAYGSAMDTRRVISSVQFYRRHYGPVRQGVLLLLIKAAAILRLLRAHLHRLAPKHSGARDQARARIAALRSTYAALKRL